MPRHATNLSVFPEKGNSPSSNKEGVRGGAPEPERGFDLIALYQMIFRRGFLFFSLIIFLSLLGAGYVAQLPPLFKGKAALLVDQRKQNVIKDEAVLSGPEGGAGIVESEIELIKSYSIARRAVVSLRLQERPDTDFKGSLLSIAGHFIASFVGLTSGDNLRTEEEKIDARVADIQRDLKVVRRGFSYVIEISYTSKSPELSAQIANGVAQAYLDDQLDSKYAATKGANLWLTDRLADLKKKLEQSEQAVEKFRSENNLIQAKGATLNEQQISKLNEQLIMARAETAQARVKYEQVMAVSKRGGDVSSFADAMQSSLLVALRSKLAETRRQLADLSTKYGSLHPEVVSTKAQLGDISHQISAETGRIVAAAENDYRVAKSREKSIEGSLSELKGDASTLSETSVRLRELEREAQANRSLYEAFLARFKETSQQQSLQLADSRLIERSLVPKLPDAPNRLLLWIMITMVGGGLAVGLVFLLERLDRMLRTAEQIKSITRAPVLAMSPRIASDHVLLQAEQTGQGVSRWFSRLSKDFSFLSKKTESGKEEREKSFYRFVIHKPLGAFAEAIRSMRMGVRYASLDRPLKVIMVSSALPSEGKSTIASNFAQQAALSGERVVLIDMDFRHPVLSSIYAPKAGVGLVELFTTGEDLNKIVVTDPDSGLSIIPAVCRPRDLPHTAEILASQRVREFLQIMAKNFDLVVVDTSPLLPVTDGRVLVDAVDGVVLVVRWEKTEEGALKEAIAQSCGLEDKLLGVVFNDVVEEKARYYDYYKSGYYAKKYPYYYGGEKKA